MRKYLVIDLGLFPVQAEALSDGGKNQVVYCTNWQAAAPEFKMFAPGLGYGHLQKKLYPFRYIEWADCIVDFEVNNNDQIHFLRQQFPLKSVVGSGLGEELENNRGKLKEVIETLGLPMQEYEMVTGLSNLKKYLKDNPDKYVKMNIFRGDRESFYTKDAETTELIFDKLAISYGPHKEAIEFLVEDAIHTDVEIGVDTFFNGNEFVKPFFTGYEYHKNLYVAKVTDELPAPLAETMDAFSGVLRELDYRGPLSTEEKIVSEKEHYFLDICSRLPAPLSSGYPKWIRNWADLIYSVGKKEETRLQIPHKYVAALALETPYAKEDYVRIDIEKGWEDRITPRVVCEVDGKLYGVKDMESVVTLTAGGETVDECLDQIKEAADHVDADGLDKDDVNGIDVACEIIEHGKKVGIPF